MKYSAPSVIIYLTIAPLHNHASQATYIHTCPILFQSAMSNVATGEMWSKSASKQFFLDIQLFHIVLRCSQVLAIGRLLEMFVMQAVRTLFGRRWRD